MGKGLGKCSELFPAVHLLFWVICMCSMIIHQILNKNVFWKGAHHELWNTYFHLPHLIWKRGAPWLNISAMSIWAFQKSSALRFTEVFGESSNKTVDRGICSSVNWADGKKHSEVCGFRGRGWFSHLVSLLCVGMPHSHSICGASWMSGR